jgi:hypothetical protein
LNPVEDKLLDAPNGNEFDGAGVAPKVGVLAVVFAAVAPNPPKPLDDV